MKDMMATAATAMPMKKNVRPLLQRELLLVLSLCAVLAGCALTPAGEARRQQRQAQQEDAPQSPERPRSPQAAFEQNQRERAQDFMRQKRLADAAIVWEILTVLRPDVADYRERLADTQRQIDADVAERMPHAGQAARRGDIEGATKQYLAILALQPQNEEAADALRALERERDRRNYLGKPSRVTITRRAMAEAEAMTLPATPQQGLAGRNDVEHAALLAGDGEFDDAIALLQHRIAIDRKDQAARRLLANVYYRKANALLPSDKRAAIAALEKSVKLDPKEPIAAGQLRQLKGMGGMPAAAAAVSGVRSGGGE